MVSTNEKNTGSSGHEKNTEEYQSVSETVHFFDIRPLNPTFSSKVVYSATGLDQSQNFKISFRIGERPQKESRKELGIATF